jgi:ribosomal protein L22
VTKPGDPSEGKAAEQEQIEAAADEAKAADAPAAKAKPKPKAKRAAKAEPEAAQAEGTAAETTGVDKAGAEAAAVTEPADEPVAEAKPKRSRTKKTPAAAAEAKPEVEKPATKAKPRRRKASAQPEPKAEPKARSRKRDDELVIVRAHARYVRSSPRKARLVCDHIRGKSVAEARAILAFSPRAVAEAWTKLLESAVANAENNHDLEAEDLKIHAVFADAGPTIKRFRPRAMGRATRVRKRTSHLTIQLTPRQTVGTGATKGAKK